MQKTAVTVGMGMTEKQGGTDVRANTLARPSGSGEGIYRLSGHKWFMSAPMSDAFVMLAQTSDGMGCFLVPRLLEDGTANGLRLPAPEGQDRQPLQRFLGGRVQRYLRLPARRRRMRGIRTILDMVTLTRLDCALASSRHHARLARGGRAPCARPQRVRQDAGRPADR